MASEFEESAETAQELISEELAENSREERSDWTSRVALSTMVIALFSAISGLLAGITANESLLERTEEILEVSKLESDYLEVEFLKSKHEILISLGESPDIGEIERISQYEGRMGESKTIREDDEPRIRATIYEHELFATAVTLFSMAITLSGMALVAKRRILWMVSLAFAVVGFGFLGFGVFQMLG
jgi:hypothetical protein